ncbi:MAG TPA: hypothetical protein DIS76_02850 [Rhodospirillaceae bacterium]|nr:hypothetical protein [Rhodospirillaceae bacterium]
MTEFSFASKGLHILPTGSDSGILLHVFEMGGLDENIFNWKALEISQTPSATTLLTFSGEELGALYKRLEDKNIRLGLEKVIGADSFLQLKNLVSIAAIDMLSQQGTMSKGNLDINNIPLYASAMRKWRIQPGT